jgi:hypothetical protein
MHANPLRGRDAMGAAMKFFRQVEAGIYEGTDAPLASEDDGAQWTREYDAILGEERPFAVIVDAAQRPQPPAGKPMSLWMKSRKAQLGAWVCATVYIVEDEALRADFLRSADKRQKATPYRMVFVASEAEALAAARNALA